MIANEKEYRVTRAAANKFQRALDNFDARPEAHPDIDPRFIPVMKAGIVSELEILKKDLKDYEQLSRRGKVKIKLNELSALPKELIRGRIAAGLTQSQLAQRLGLKTQQIQKYETNDYAMASYTRLMEIAQALHQAASERQVNQVR
jgi:DNA-binding XRE family transcriptional regulator